MSKKDRREQRKADRLAKQKTRLAKAAEHPTLGKQPKIPAFDSDAEARVLWSFSHFDPYDWRNDKSAAHVSFTSVASRLKEYSGRSWGEIETDRSRDHPCDPASLCPDAQRRLTELNFDDVDLLFRFRFDGTQRLWGFRDRAHFIVLWWDPDHGVWPVEKRNT